MCVAEQQLVLDFFFLTITTVRDFKHSHIHTNREGYNLALLLFVALFWGRRADGPWELPC